ncbi:MAG TPA: outer membrane beta-barrel protein [Gemmatimonadales bacterium]|nr:outer membrane beta-barrel protein [Gemmatimonadota bacterium]MCB9505152.1 outer membrane beta-barrel protein [Gemmatimonadales bacterium]MCB9518674.1 outer membrane beta-barrel protein [Gemmatimonadales bacterium]HPF61484.1 outer membrane beta-barrel protein [Gemmatimonadales bacterium]HRX19052.1 outer membrane beta-barrel protein [Gemmatimonadales bacterium]
MQRTISFLALAALLVGSTTAADAQGRRDRGLVELAPESIRGGFYIGGGLGAGRESYKFADETGYSEPLTKPTFTLRLGGTPDPYVRLGGELFAWANDDFDRTEYFSTLMGVVQFYPIKDGGLWLKGGAGMAFSGQSFDDPQFFDVNETGFGWTVGAGYEAQLSRKVGIGPSVEFYQGSFTKRNEPTLTERVLNIGVQVTFQTGGRRR